MDPLKVARQIRKLMAGGMSNAQARAKLGLPPKRKAGAGHHTGHTTTEVVYLDKPRARRRRRSGGGETIVPTRDGTDVTTRAGASLHASFNGHVKVAFDEEQVGALWTGAIRQWRNGSATPLQAVFPGRFPIAAAVETGQRNLAQERAIGSEMAKILGAAIIAYGISADEWAAIYAAAVTSGQWQLPEMEMLPGSGGGTQQLAAPQSNWGSITGAPQLPAPVISSPFGATR